MNVALKILEKKALGKLRKDKRSINSDVRSTYSTTFSSRPLYG